MVTKTAAAASDTENPTAKKRRARIAAAMGDAGSDKRKTRRKLVAKMYRLLTKAPAEDGAKIADTPFSAAGVERLMTLLKKRADEPGEAGAKASAGMIKFLAGDDDGEKVAGASVEKLRWIAKMGKRFNK